MADDLNKKISIDVEINTDGQQQINQYKASFDNLRDSINSLDKDLEGFTDSVNKLNSQNQSLADSGNKVKDTVTDLSGTFKIFKGAIEAVQEGAIGLTDALSGGLAILVTFAPEIIKWVGNMLKGNSTLSALNQTLHDHKVALQAVTDAKSQGDKNAQQELVNLKLLYNASQDQTLSLKDRKKAIAELQSQYPSYFGNMSSELILTGKAAKAYVDLSKAIIDTARAKAAEQMIVKNSERQIDDKSKTDDLQQQINAKKAELKAAQKEHDDVLSAMQGAGNGSTFGTSSTDSAGDAKIARLTDEVNTLQKTSWDASNDYLILDKKNQALTKYIHDNIQKDGIGVITGTGSTEGGGQRNGGYSNRGNSNTASSASTQPSSSPQRDTTILDPASSIGASQIDDQSAGFTNATIAADNDIAAKPDPALVAKFTAAKQAAQQLKDFEIQTAQQVSTAAFGILQNSIKQQSEAKIAALENQKNTELSNTSLTSAQKLIIEQKYKQKEGQEKVKAFKEEQEASLAQAVINGALAITKATSQTGVLSPFVIPGIIAETAIQVATIVAQKPPAYAAGGLHYTSDGKGGMLPGYSRTDNTNAYLRSGEGIVVSEAMRDPWARNLVSAINVGFGGRDFSTNTTGRGFAVGGIFTDGGDANRYYNAPVNDQKNLANSIAYQMINNFPPVYVDVKDINSQQNILAQTINRVNL